MFYFDHLHDHVITFFFILFIIIIVHINCIHEWVAVKFLYRFALIPSTLRTLLSLPVTSSSSEPLYTLGERPCLLVFLCLSYLINTLSSRCVHFFSADGLLFLFMYGSTSFHVHTKLFICSLALSCVLWAALQ